MAIRVLEQTVCYKCECELMAPKGEVHPLCAECQADFDAWFTGQLAVFDK
jgi:hypothetical protein